MSSSEEDALDIREILSRLTLPTTPAQSMGLAQGELDAIRSWKRSKALALVAGMLTDVRYHAHVIRLDWLTRLITAHAEGKKKPKRRELANILNKALSAALVTNLEDPIEGFFVEAVPTSRGDMLIFEGHWEGAAQCTETVLRAFERLPDAPLKHQALDAAYTLLRLSTALVERSGLERRAFNEGTPQGNIAVPSDERFQKLARRVSFTEKDLNEIGVSIADLRAYILDPSHFKAADQNPVGSSVLDYFPLIELDDGILVANAGAMSLAARATLLDVAYRGGVGLTLIAHLAEVQEEFALSTGFWPVRELQLSSMSDHLLRASIVRFAPGRYLHVVQTMPDPASFVDEGFGSTLTLRTGADAAIGSDVSKFWQFLSAQPDYRESLTVVLLSGWGGSAVVSPHIDETSAPANWQFLALSFADAATLGACEDGRLRDLWRIQDQLEILEGVGYEVQRLNGVINLFGNWRETGSNLVPEHWDANPPATLWLPHDSLLKPRMEGEANRDVRSVPLPDGSFEIVQRTEWNQDGKLKPIYGSLNSIKDGRLIGVICLEGRSWWIEITDEEDAPEHREWQYQVWNAVVQWLGVSASQLIARFPESFAPKSCRIRLVIRSRDASRIEEIGHAEGLARDHIVLSEGASVYEVYVKEGWFSYLRQVVNDAEFALASAVVEQIAHACGKSLTQDKIDKCLREAVPSPDWRYLHAFEAKYPLDRLIALGLYPRFKKISRSASALVRCGSVWRFWDRSKGSEFSGEEECRAFLSSYYEFVLKELIEQIRPFNRESLLRNAALAYGAARAEGDRWKRTIRAMRSIHGASVDVSALERSSEFNAVQRAAKAICEIGACEAQEIGGAMPANEDLDEMFARSLLLFGNGQLYATIRGGLVKPHLKISPAGDLLSDRSLFEKTFIPSTQRAHSKSLDDAAESYVSRLEKEDESEVGDKLPWSDEFRTAVSAEYNCSPEAFVDLQFRIIQLCEATQQGVIVMRRSELAMAVTSEDFPDRDIAGLLERLTLKRRDEWQAQPEGYSARDLELWRFDRKHSTISRPLIAISSERDPLLLVSPLFVSDATMYQLGALHYATVHNDSFWNSKEAKAYAGSRANEIGKAFEDEVLRRLTEGGFSAWPRKKITALLGQAVNGDLGDIDVFVLSSCGGHVLAIEAKSLKLCRTEAEVATRMTEYAGKTREDEKGRERPDKLLRHLRRVQVLRENAVRLGHRLGLATAPQVHGLMVVEAPQPMNFFMLEEKADGASCIVDDMTEVIQRMFGGVDNNKVQHAMRS
jgi:hypothetical protein